MKPGIATVGFYARPVRCHPGRPAELAELADPDRLGGARRDRQLGIPIELLANVEEYQIG